MLEFLIRAVKKSVFLACLFAPVLSLAASEGVELTWMSIANWYIQAGQTRIIMDGFVTRIPGSPFFYAPPSIPGDQYAYTQEAYGFDVPAITKVQKNLLQGEKLDYLMVGHSHWDHSWDTPTWSKLTGAPIIGGISTCYQAQAQHIDKSLCKAVSGGEKIQLSETLSVRVVRFNHSGNTANPIQHFARELYRAPTPDSQGRFRAGVGEDYPNGGGNRAYLFTLEQAQGRLSFFINSSASAYDLDKDIIVDGVNYGSPLNNLRAAMKDAGLERVDAWIGTGGREVAELIVPVIKPRSYIPHHWDGLFNSFWAGIPYPYKDEPLKEYLDKQSVKLISQKQYFDRFLLSSSGVTVLDNSDVKSKLGFAQEQKFSSDLVDVVNRVASTSGGDDCGETPDTAFESPLASSVLGAQRLP
jgi:L-ascorbate metabolism protein UlaG (beta-lactamase superfamily)